MASFASRWTLDIVLNQCTNMALKTIKILALEMFVRVMPKEKDTIRRHTRSTLRKMLGDLASAVKP